MARRTVALLAIIAIPAGAMAQADTTRRPDSTLARQSPDTTRRIRAESRGEVDPRVGRGFDIDLPNYGLTREQAAELQQALARVGCDVGPTDGVVGQRTLRGLQCFRAQQPLTVPQVDSLLFALNVSFARPPAPIEPPPPVKRDTTVLPPVIRPDTTYRPDVRARRDSALRRDSTVLRDPLNRDTTARADTTVRRDSTVRRPRM